MSTLIDKPPGVPLKYQIITIWGVPHQFINHGSGQIITFHKPEIRPAMEMIPGFGHDVRSLATRISPYILIDTIVDGFTHYYHY